MNYREQQQIKSFGKHLNEFCSRYRAYARTGPTMRRAEPISFKNWKDDDFYHAHMNTYEVPALELTISEEDLQKLMDDLAEVDTPDYNEYQRMRKMLGEHFLLDLHSYKLQQAREDRARRENPGVQKAWENYQLMLKLAGG